MKKQIPFEYIIGGPNAPQAEARYVVEATPGIHHVHIEFDTRVVCVSTGSNGVGKAAFCFAKNEGNDILEVEIDFGESPVITFGEVNKSCYDCTVYNNDFYREIMLKAIGKL